jgi:ketosteroid isomerase-like protein
LRTVTEESTTPDLVELTRSLVVEASDRDWDLDAVMRFYAPDVVWDMSVAGLGTYEGVAAVREFIESWWATWEDHHHHVEEIRDFGHGVVYVALRETGRLVGSSTPVEQRNVSVLEWAHGKIVRVTTFVGRRKARAAAERLAEERG